MSAGLRTWLTMAFALGTIAYLVVAYDIWQECREAGGRPVQGYWQVFPECLR